MYILIIKRIELFSKIKLIHVLFQSFLRWNLNSVDGCFIIMIAYCYFYFAFYRFNYFKPACGIIPICIITQSKNQFWTLINDILYGIFGIVSAAPVACCSNIKIAQVYVFQTMDVIGIITGNVIC